MGNKTRNTGNLVSDTNIFVDISNDRVGIGSTQPTAKLDVVGIISATSFYGDGTNLTGLTGASAATYGNGTAVPQITVDANGRITGISNVLISGGSSLIIQDSQSLVGTAGTIDFGTGLSVTPVSAGIVTVTVDGSELTNLNASQLTSGTIPNARLPAGIASETYVGLATAGLLSETGDGSQLTGIVTSITAGNGIVIDQSTGNVTITSNVIGGYFEKTDAGIHTTSNVGVGTTNPLTPLQVERYGVDTTIDSWTASAGVLQQIDSISTDFQTAEYTLHFTHSSGIQAQKVLLMHDGTTAYSQEYGIMYSSDLLVSVGSSIHNGNLTLNVTPETGVSGLTTYRFTRQSML